MTPVEKMKKIIEQFDDFAKSLPLLIYFQGELTMIRFLMFGVIYATICNVIFWLNNI